MSFTKTTEQASKYQHLEQMSVQELLTNINQEDKTVPFAVEKALPQIETFVQQIVSKMKQGGRLFYIGAGTSGRLGVVDASECPPTFGVPFDQVIGLIAGGDTAIRKAVENAEDDVNQAWMDLQVWNISEKDVVVGIAASVPLLMLLVVSKNAIKITLSRDVLLVTKEVHYQKQHNFPLKLL